MTEQLIPICKSNAQTNEEELQQFVYKISHDLGAPIRHVSTFLSLLIDDHSDALNEDAMILINNAIKASERSKTMMEALCQFSRVQTEAREFAITDLNALMNELKNTTLESAATGAIVFDSMHLPDVMGDTKQLATLFNTLINNAVSHNESEAVVIAVQHAVIGGFNVIDFVDNAKVIPSKHGEQIFEMFHRLDGKSDTQLGTGLPIARRIARLHGGELRLSDDLNNQNCFRLTLPITESH